MKKNTLIKILCLVLVCVMILPLAIACKKDTGDYGGNNNGGSSTGGNNNGGNGWGGFGNDGVQ